MCTFEVRRAFATSWFLATVVVKLASYTTTDKEPAITISLSPSTTKIHTGMSHYRACPNYQTAPLFDPPPAAACCPQDYETSSKCDCVCVCVHCATKVLFAVAAIKDKVQDSQLLDAVLYHKDYKP